MNFEDKIFLIPFLQKCRNKDRNCQQQLYRQLFAFAMKIGLRYAKTREEAQEIVNDGFVKVFAKLDKYNPDLSFLGWVRKIMVNTAIDHYRRNMIHYDTLDMSYAETSSVTPEVMQKMSAEDLLNFVRQLPNAYRMVFNLYAIEGYNHREIGEILNINEGTSKSNLAKARVKLKKMIEEQIERGLKYG